MKTYPIAFTLMAVLVLLGCLSLAARVTIAAPDAGATTTIRNCKSSDLRHHRRRDYLVRQWRRDDLATAVNTNGFTNQLLAANEFGFSSSPRLVRRQGRAHQNHQIDHSGIWADLGHV